jgi:stage II sporulation protein D
VPALILVLGIGSCTPHEEAAELPAPVVREPELQIGLLVDVPRVTIGGNEALRVTSAGGGAATIARASSVDVTVRDDLVSVPASTSIVGSDVTVAPIDANGTVRVNGRDYPGTVAIRKSDKGVVVVNRVSLERYVAAVVGAEMGARQPGDIEALKAQAVASRTYAVRNQGRWKARGFDLVAAVDNQLYNGIASEYPLATQATVATRGEILTYQGQPIDAFFFSTCGGRTEDGEAVYPNARRPYLRSIDDRDPSGTPWCAISPRYTWHSSWTAAELRAVLSRTLPANALPVEVADDLTDIGVQDHAPSGRVASVALTSSQAVTVVAGQNVRRVLASPAGALLPSTDFTIRVARDGERIERVDIDGHGNGHGVGMCQWGAVGRARAGQGYVAIVTSYFPGTELRRLY